MQGHHFDARVFYSVKEQLLFCSTMQDVLCGSVINNKQGLYYQNLLLITIFCHSLVEGVQHVP